MKKKTPLIRSSTKALLWIIIAASLLAAVVLLVLSYRHIAKDPEKITFAHSSLPFAGIAQVAQMQGYFRSEGLDVEPRIHSYGKIALEALIDGKADFATVAETPFMLAILNGKKIMIIATIQTSNDNHAIVARKDRGILSPSDLKGKIIGTTFGTSAHFFLDVFLLTHGVITNEIRVVNLEPDKLQEALQKGAVDAVSAWNPTLLTIQKEFEKQVVTFYDLDIYKQTFNVITTEKYVDKHPDRVIKLLRGLLRAEKFIKQKPLEAQRIVAEFSDTDPKLLAEFWKANKFSVSLDQSLLLALEDEANWAISRGLASGNVPDFSKNLYLIGLESIRPDAVRILR